MAALRIVGAALSKSEVKSGPPPLGGLCGRGAGGGAGRFVVVRVGGGGVRSMALELPGSRDSQHTVPLLQDLVLCRIFEGFVHKLDMD